jgi:O-acetyl-ADP-ribose deacetylase (regulator of RNase III)
MSISGSGSGPKIPVNPQPVQPEVEYKQVDVKEANLVEASARKLAKSILTGKAEGGQITSKLGPHSAKVLADQVKAKKAEEVEKESGLKKPGLKAAHAFQKVKNLFLAGHLKTNMQLLRKAEVNLASKAGLTLKVTADEMFKSKQVAAKSGGDGTAVHSTYEEKTWEGLAKQFGRELSEFNEEDHSCDFAHANPETGTLVMIDLAGHNHPVKHGVFKSEFEKVKQLLKDSPSTDVIPGWVNSEEAQSTFDKGLEGTFSCAKLGQYEGVNGVFSYQKGDSETFIVGADGGLRKVPRDPQSVDANLADKRDFDIQFTPLLPGEKGVILLSDGVTDFLNEKEISECWKNAGGSSENFFQLMEEKKLQKADGVSFGDDGKLVVGSGKPPYQIVSRINERGAEDRGFPDGTKPYFKDRKQNSDDVSFAYAAFPDGFAPVQLGKHEPINGLPGASFVKGNIAENQFKGKKTVVVNAANPELQWGRGGTNKALSEVISKKNWESVHGPTSRNPLAKKEPKIQVGEAKQGPLISNGFSMVQALGPRLDEKTTVDQLPNLQQQVYEAYSNALKLAKEQGAKCVQLPQMCTGSFMRDASDEVKRVWPDMVNAAFLAAVRDNTENGQPEVAMVIPVDAKDPDFAKASKLLDKTKFTTAYDEQMAARQKDAEVAPAKEFDPRASVYEPMPIDEEEESIDQPEAAPSKELDLKASVYEPMPTEVDVNADTPLETLKEMAQEGDVKAQLELGFRYLTISGAKTPILMGESFPYDRFKTMAAKEFAEIVTDSNADPEVRGQARQAILENDLLGLLDQSIQRRIELGERKIAEELLAAAQNSMEETSGPQVSGEQGAVLNQQEMNLQKKITLLLNNILDPKPPISNAQKLEKLRSLLSNPDYVKFLTLEARTDPNKTLSSKIRSELNRLNTNPRKALELAKERINNNNLQEAREFLQQAFQDPSLQQEAETLSSRIAMKQKLQDFREIFQSLDTPDITLDDLKKGLARLLLLQKRDETEPAVIQEMAAMIGNVESKIKGIERTLPPLEERKQIAQDAFKDFRTKYDAFRKLRNDDDLNRALAELKRLRGVCSAELNTVSQLQEMDSTLPIAEGVVKRLTTYNQLKAGIEAKVAYIRNGNESLEEKNKKIRELISTDDFQRLKNIELDYLRLPAGQKLSYAFDLIRDTKNTFSA